MEQSIRGIGVVSITMEVESFERGIEFSSGERGEGAQPLSSSVTG